MSSRLLRFLLALYPPRWRRRYGRELQDLVTEMAQRGDRSRARLTAGLLANAAAEWLHRSRRQTAGALVLVAVLAGAVVAIDAAPPSPRSTVTVTRRHAPPVLVAPAVGPAPGTCFVSSGSVCSQSSCTEEIGTAPATVAVPARRWECATNPRVHPHTVFVTATVSRTERPAPGSRPTAAAAAAGARRPPRR